MRLRCLTGWLALDLVQFIQESWLVVTEYWLTTPFLRFKLKCQIVKTFEQTEYVNRRIPFYYYSKKLSNHSTIAQLSFRETGWNQISVLLDGLFWTWIWKSNQFSLEGFLEREFPQLNLHFNFLFFPVQSYLPTVQYLYLDRQGGKNTRLRTCKIFKRNDLICLMFD